MIMRAGRFSHSVEMVRGKKVHRIVCSSQPMDMRVYHRMVRWIKTEDNYAPIDNKKMAVLKSVLGNLNKRYSTNVSIDQILSLRNIVLKDKIIKNYARMNNMIADIASEYDTTDIVKLSAKYDFPPLNLLRGIFIYKNYNVGDVYKIFANKEDPKIILRGRDLRQFKRAEANDAESTFNQQKVAKIAEENEIRVVNFFKKLGISMLTQDDLVKEQTEKFGRPIITPDVLFIDQVYINGDRIHWIDYKDYLGTNVKFLLISNINQAAKYTNKWGPGALCFRYSYVEGVIISATLLDARSLPVKLK